MFVPKGFERALLIGKQLMGRSAFSYQARIHDSYSVTIYYSVKSLGDCEHSALPEIHPHHFLNHFVCFVVDACCCLI